MRTVAIIPSAGTGTRAGFVIPKQFLKIKGKEILAYTLNQFQRSELIDEIVVVTSESGFEITEKIKSQFGFNKITKIIEGGKERQDSVYNGLKSISNYQPDTIVAVHDAARALITVSVIDKSIVTAKKTGGALVCLNARDTLLQNVEGVKKYPDRRNFSLVQTPQVFRLSDLLTAFERAYKENFYGTDESSLMLKYGFDFEIVEGSVFNFKITNREDVEIFEKLCEDF
ncbi:MAG: 2-C-methyl-D-erythritol 4-phosphate cytidylyltransferase [Ignavibacteriaceae bacterium]|nr:2-C-methyl-D-erythritol 4-phosphate cytidylyltransferase [Ignavibacteriaceae bacterium]